MSTYDEAAARLVETAERAIEQTRQAVQQSTELARALQAVNAQRDAAIAALRCSDSEVALSRLTNRAALLPVIDGRPH